MKIKSRHKLIPAVAMVLVSAVVLSSASYAWFTMSRTVTAEGISLTAVAPTNLLINHQATDGDDAKDKFAESTTIKENYSGSLIPASSPNGTAFYAPREISSEDSGAPTATTIFDLVTTAMAENDKDAQGYYADFKLWLKTTGDKAIQVSVNQKNDATKIADKTTPVASKTSIIDAVRFAVLDSNGAVITSIAGNKTANSTYELKGGSVAKQDYIDGLFGPITKEGVAGAAFTGTKIDDNNSALALFTVKPGDTATPIIVRVWIEGQAKDCLGTAAKADFNLQLGFKDVDYTDVVTP